MHDCRRAVRASRKPLITLGKQTGTRAFAAAAAYGLPKSLAIFLTDRAGAAAASLAKALPRGASQVPARQSREACEPGPFRTALPTESANRRGFR